MSNLIITIIAIALVAVAATMAAYYGATAWNESNERAKAVTLLNQKEQIKQAAAMYKAKSGKITPSMAHLDSDNADLLGDGNPAYDLLSTPPSFENGAWQSAGNKVFVEFPGGMDEESVKDVCAAAWADETRSDIADFPPIPACDAGDATLEGHVCCVSN